MVLFRAGYNIAALVFIGGRADEGILTITLSMQICLARRGGGAPRLWQDRSNRNNSFHPLALRRVRLPLPPPLSSNAPDHARPAQVPFHQITSHLRWPLSRKARQDAGRIAYGLQRQQKLHCSGGVAPKQRHHLGIAKPERKGRDHRCIPRRRKPALAVVLLGLATTP